MSSLHHKATFAAQKNFSSACFFMPFYLVNPNNCVTHTHTHTHTQERDQYKRYARRARNIQHKHLQTKGVQEVFYKLFACPFCMHK